MADSRIQPDLTAYSTGRVLRLGGWGFGIAAALTVFYTLAYYYLLGAIVAPPPIHVVALWQATAMTPWIAVAPLVVWLSEHLPPPESVLSPRLAGHAVFALVITLAHMLWFTWATLWLVPFEFLAVPLAAMNHFVRYHFVVDVLLYGGLVAVAGRAALLGFGATGEGLIRVAGMAAGGPEPVGMADSPRRPRHTPVLIYDPATLGVLAVNEAAVETYAHRAPAFKSLGLQDLFAPADFRRFVEHLRASGALLMWMGRGTHLRASGQAFQVEYFNSRVLFAGRPAMLLLVNDVSEEEASRQALMESERNAAELRVQLADAQLRALKLQIKPHFLFNVLNMVAMMIRNGETARAQQVVTMLGGMFRRFLDFEGTAKVSLRQELDFVDLYMALQQLRFEDRMDMGHDVAPDTLHGLVPTLILQPLVENAIQHGVAPAAGRVRVDIAARRDGDTLVVEVVNDMPAQRPAADHPRRGIGVRNTRERLRESYGDRGRLELTPEAGRMRAVLTIPFERADAAA